MTSKTPASDSAGSAVTLKYTIDFSVVVTCFNESAVLAEFHSRLSEVLLETDYCFEIIYVNDGSYDNSYSIMKKLQKECTCVVVVDLMKNYGQWNAISAGIEVSHGRDFIFLDCDLEIPPEQLQRFLEAFKDGADLVSGVRQDRKNSWQRRLISLAGNTALRCFLGIEARDIGCGMKIIKGTLVRHMVHDAHHPFLPFPMFQAATKTVNIPIPHSNRHDGKSRWNIFTLLRFYIPEFFFCLNGHQKRMRRLAVVCFIMTAISGVLIFSDISSLNIVMCRASFLALSFLLTMNGIILLLCAQLLDKLGKPRKKPYYRIRKLKRT
jgi:glycosyltransferase involved in cell wall biosynthesis